MTNRSSFGRNLESKSKSPSPDPGGEASEYESLAQEVKRLRKETEQRNAELAIINSVQEGLASKLDIQSIHELVGEQLHQVFPQFDISVAAYDPENDLVTTGYIIEHDKRLNLPPFHVENKGFIGKMLRTRKTVVVNENLAEESRKLGGRTLEGTSRPKSHVLVPLMIHGVVRGLVVMQDMQREHAFSNPDIRLLETIANSMSVALENARLFDETQRLLKDTKQQAAELAIINSVQEGLASKLDVQAIYDLVGNKIREVFKAESTLIALYDGKKNEIQFPYVIDETGKRFDQGPKPLSTGLSAHIIKTKVPLVINQDFEKLQAELGSRPFDPAHPPKAYLGVPMLVGQDVVGVVALSNLEENTFNDSDVRLLTTIANSMSVALENARLFDETQHLLKETEQRNAELAIINSVQQGLSSKLDMLAIYELVGNKIREIFHDTDAEIRIYDPQTNLVHIPYITDAGERITVDPMPLTNLGISSHILRTGQTLVINENFTQAVEKYGSQFVFGGHPAKSGVFVPLMAGNQARGLIVLGNVEREHAFSPSDVRLFQTLANSMSTALENARLFDETQRLLKETEQRAAELAIINSVQEGLASKLDMQAIYDLVGDKIRDLLNTQSVWIIMFDPATRTRRVRYSFESGQRYYTSELFPYNKLTEHLITTKKPLVINQNFTEAIARFEMVNMAGTQEQIKSIAYIPIIAGEDVKGFISLPNIERENAFSESDINLLSTFASSMSIALENIRLFDETRRLLKETERADQAKSAFLSSMSHELRTPLNAIINFVEMVARGMIGPVNQEQVEILDQALHSSKHLLNLINDVLDISKIQAGQLTLFMEDQVSVQVEVEAALSIVGGLLQEKGLQLIRDIDPQLPLVPCDRRRVRQVLLNLISNAIKFTNQGTVTVSLKNHEAEVLFAVIDTGPGIPPEEQELIFEPFLQAENGERQVQGTGLGLPISRSLVRAHGGELWVESQRGEGSAFFFTLPVASHRERTP